VATLDHVSEQWPPFSPEETVREFCRTLRAYRCQTVVGDRYGGQWPREQCAKYGVTYECSELVKSDIYREVLPMLTRGQVRLLDHPRLLGQFLGLERRVGRSGRDTIDHAPHAHDDLSNSASGALVLAAGTGAGNSDVGPIAANLAPEPRGRIVDDRELELMRRGDGDLGVISFVPGRGNASQLKRCPGGPSCTCSSQRCPQAHTRWKWSPDASTQSGRSARESGSGARRRTRHGDDARAEVEVLPTQAELLAAPEPDVRAMSTFAQSGSA
jgi:hypothetical protein